MNRIALTFLLIVFSAHINLGQSPCAPAKHAKLPAITELTYVKARKSLLIAGWQPLQTILDNEANENPDIAAGNGRLFWKRGYREIEFCSGTGIAACGFLFKDAYGNRLRVTTAGEEFPKQRVYARVKNYQLVCDN